jgi:pimeloyl-ACP methyl ester carboxylesterase
LFEYDAASPLQPVSTLVEEHVDGDLHDLSYRVTESSDCAHAWMIVPTRSDSLPYVVYLHGGGQGRGAFLNEAFLLADLGIASLLIDLPQARAFPDFSSPDKDQNTFFQTVIAVRRGVDCLALRSNIDINRGAIVGFSFGAWIGSVVAAVDGRLRRAILTAGVPRMSEFWRASTHPDVVSIRDGLPSPIMERFVEASRPFDAIEHLRRCSNIRLFFQFGTGDEIISQEHVREFSPYAVGRNQLKIYESGSHYQIIFDPDARHDRLSWLQDQLLGSGLRIN